MAGMLSSAEAESLQSCELSEYLDSIERIWQSLSAGDLALDRKVMERICRVLKPQGLSHKDLRSLQSEVLSVLFSNRDVIGNRLVVGLATYTIGLIENCYDGSGFNCSGTELELHAVGEARQVAQILARGAQSEAASALCNYASLLERVAAGYDRAQQILSKVGNQHLDLLGEQMAELDDVCRRRVLQALSAFRDESAVQQFYADYLACCEREQQGAAGAEEQTLCALRTAQARQYIADQPEVEGERR